VLGFEWAVITGGAGSVDGGVITAGCSITVIVLVVVEFLVLLSVTV